MHKNYYRHFIKIYETNIHKNTLRSVIAEAADKGRVEGEGEQKLEHH